MLAPGATIFDRDGTMQSADTTKRSCGTGARFPKQPSRSQFTSISFWSDGTVHAAIFEIVSELGGEGGWFADC